MKQIEFEGKIQTEGRIQLPKRLRGWVTGEKVLVLLTSLEEEEKTNQVNEEE